MQQKVLSPLGVEVADLSLRHLNADSIEELRRLLADHGMVVLRGQEIDDAEFSSPSWCDSAISPSSRASRHGDRLRPSGGVAHVVTMHNPDRLSAILMWTGPRLCLDQHRANLLGARVFRSYRRRSAYWPYYFLHYRSIWH